MNFSSTPIFDAVAMQFLDDDVNITAIMERPKYQIPTVDTDERWREINARWNNENLVKDSRNNKNNKNNKPRK